MFRATTILNSLFLPPRTLTSSERALIAIQGCGESGSPVNREAKHPELSSFDLISPRFGPARVSQLDRHGFSNPQHPIQ